jgi:putative membrane protein
VFGIVGIYFLFKGFGIDETFHYFYGSLQHSLTYGRFSFVTYIVTMLIGIIGVMMGLSQVLLYYPSEESLGIFLLTVIFIHGSVGWFVLSGLILSIGRIIDFYFNEQESLGKVIVLPFFVGAIGTVAFGASVYTLSISAIPDFPQYPGGGVQYLAFTLVGGLVCAFVGVYIQSLIKRWQGHVSAASH